MAQKDIAQGLSGWQRFALFIALIGSANWGLIAFFNFNLVSSLLGSDATMIVYGVVGVAGLFSLWWAFGKRFRMWTKKTLGIKI